VAEPASESRDQSETFTLFDNLIGLPAPGLDDERYGHSFSSRFAVMEVHRWVE